MEGLLLYLSKSAVILALFYTCFKSLLSEETFFMAKRVYLLLGLLTSIFLPLVVITHYIEVDPEPFIRQIIPSPGDATANEKVSVWSWKSILIKIYFIGIFLIFIRLVYQGFCVARLIIQGEQYREEDFIHVCIEQSVLPFSFFNYIVYNPTLHSTNDLAIILKHEKHTVVNGTVLTLFSHSFSYCYSGSTPSHGCIKKKSPKT